jgi:sugar (pentulose or hexulose) kinase
VAAALHLPQYLSFLFTHHTAADLTSIGCHTQLWNFQTQQYHNWVRQEKIDSILPPITSATSTTSVNLENTQIQVGIGLHDSSAALIPYLTAFSVPFILISTGTWCISLHPFNNDPLTPHELENDCLFFMGYHGKPVKAARLFAGHEHEVQTKRIANHFNVAADFYTSVVYDKSYIDFKLFSSTQNVPVGVHGSGFEQVDLSDFKNEQHAYHTLIAQLMVQQKTSTSLVLGPTKVQRIFVDGGFGKNTIYMNLLAAVFPNIEVYAASVAQATAVGAALAIHESWNTKSIPNDMIELKFYTTL